MRRGMIGAIGWAMAALLALGGTTQAEMIYRIDDLGVLPDKSASLAYGINQRGQVVGVSLAEGGIGARAFLYEGGPLRDLGVLGRFDGAAYGINNSGQTVGGSFIGIAGSRAVLYGGGTLSDLGTLPGGNTSVGSAINDAGQVVGSSNGSGHPFHAFLYANGVMRDLGTLPGGDFSQASGINASGRVVGLSSIGVGPSAIQRAFLYDGGAMIDLGTLPGDLRSLATAINDSGTIVGASYLNSINESRAFLLKDGVMLGLGALPDQLSSRAMAVNGTDDVVGYANTYFRGDVAFLYSRGVLTDLDSLLPAGSGWTLRRATGINDYGQIVGYGDYNGQTRAFLMTPVPEPSTLFLLGLGGAILFGLRDARGGRHGRIGRPMPSR